ncbi:alcohol dehydrogenase catalytic domain-containing protein [Saccharopolyspora sp. NPDC047091]|uniref:alcohol dehydrogenase catalytic domain-containing protein n=1 Tax=Saccharopolyspora sp. NPDC047091 TaxID=3155924 RepID=UPI00340E138C
MVVSAGEPVRWQLTDGPEPVIGPADLLVRVVAAGLNRADLLMRRGDYVPDSADWRVPADRVGFEMAGHVVAVGAQVRGVDVGQPVMAQTGGACAELVAVDHRSALPVPDADDLVRAAGRPSGLHAIVDSTFGFDDAERAAARLAEPDSCGKVVLRHDGARP